MSRNERFRLNLLRDFSHTFSGFMWKGVAYAHGQTVFSQLMDILPRHEFNRCVGRYQAKNRVRKFSCLDQFHCMVLAKLTDRESLRDTETCPRAVQPKLYFVVRSKSSLPFCQRAYHHVDKSKGLRSDHRILLQGPKTSQAYPDTLRLISYVDTDSHERLVFLTHNFFLAVPTIAAPSEIPPNPWPCPASPVLLSRQSPRHPVAVRPVTSRKLGYIVADIPM